MDSNNITLVGEWFNDNVAVLEEYQEELFRLVSEVSSPAFHNTTLPVFSKINCSKEVEKDICSYRLNLLKQQGEEYNKKLNAFRDKLDAKNSAKHECYHEMTKLIDDFVQSYGSGAGTISSTVVVGSRSSTNFPIILAPSLQEMENAIKRASMQHNRIVADRLQLALELFKKIIHSTRQLAQQHYINITSICDTQHVVIKSLLEMYYDQLSKICITVKKFYEDNLIVNVKKLQKYAEHEKQMAIECQSATYKQTLESLKAQHALFNSMISCLSYELDQLSGNDMTSGVKIRLQKRLDELKRNNQSLFHKAELYYESSKRVVILQPLSPVFYQAVRQWLLNYQSILVEALSAALLRRGQAPEPPIHNENNDDKDNDATAAFANENNEDDNVSNNKMRNMSRYKNNKNKSSTTSMKGPGSIAPNRSILLSYASKIEPAKLIKLSEASSFTKPESDTIDSILLSFAHFHMDENRKNMNHLISKIKQLDIEKDELSKHVAKIHKDRTQWYTSHESKLPSLRACGGSGSSSSSATAGLCNISPEAMKFILALEKKLKMYDAQLASIYQKFHEEVGPDYLNFEQKQEKLLEIVEYLKQYQKLLREWESRIQEEYAFVQKCKNIKQFTSNAICEQFIKCNYFVTEQMESFQSTIMLFSVNTLYKVKEYGNICITHALNESNKRESELVDELQLIGKFYDDIKNEEGSFGDVIDRTQKQIVDWARDINYLYEVFIEYRLESVIDYYHATLQNIIERFSGDHELGDLLLLLDNMYRNINREEQEEQETESRKTQFLMKS